MRRRAKGKPTATVQYVGKEPVLEIPWMDLAASEFADFGNLLYRLICFQYLFFFFKKERDSAEALFHKVLTCAAVSIQAIAMRF